ncbi:MAG: radical SAM protein [Planctomycetes bacterium]|nr:radical SAM protein [Planctomycetota bacterium]
MTVLKHCQSAPSPVDISAMDHQDLLTRHRQSMRRFMTGYKNLPFATQATCPVCFNQVPAEFKHPEEGGVQVVLEYQCPDCGFMTEVHQDAIWIKPEPDRSRSAVKTHAGSTIKPNMRLLPRTVETLCPECSAVIVGRYFVEDDMVLIEKTCPDHGYYRDIINRDVRMYLKAAYWSFEELPGLTNPAVSSSGGCPTDCGLCGSHQSCSCLANIDLTNRCNLNCPICFANANASGYVCEPDFDQVVAMLQALRDMRPTPATAIQFTGGEPTVHPRFFDIVRRAGEMGFSNIQIATNGLKMADWDFARRACDAGLHTLYLQFDGIGPEVYLATRNKDIWDKKLQAVENCRRLDMKICLVPTIVKTINDDQVGPIFRFAMENVDVVSAISYQPVCFTGRIDAEKRLQQRYTLGDLARDIAAASGAVVERDFYPLSIVMPLSQLLETITGDTKIKPSCHTDCAFGSYFFISPDQKAYSFPQVLDIEGFFSGMNRLAHKFSGRAGKLNTFDKIRLLRFFKSLFRRDQIPPDLTVDIFVQTIQGMVDKNKGRGASSQSNYRTLMAAGMHFQDRYNYDVERVKRCVIPYSTPAGIIPFCAYNSGPNYRPLIEKLYAR